ncbi:type I restriction endonuclease subunit R [Candidatus Omnitrophota bacterium]
MNQYAWNEKNYVEEPFLNQLERLGWSIIRAGRDDAPEVTLREDFHSVVIEQEFYSGLKQINSWMEDDQIRDVLRRIAAVQPGTNLIEANRQFLEQLLEQIVVDKNRQTGQLNPNVKLIDFEHPEKNRFLAISQYKVTLPGGMKHIIPDIVLFVNGLPLVVVECKSPQIAEPMVEGVKQLMRYMCRRGDKEEGSEKLFYYNQMVVSTYRTRAKYSTITGELEHFNEWKDPYPYAIDQIQTDKPEEPPSSQHLLIQGMLTKEHLLDIIYNFVVFQELEIGTIKVAPRYQQFRSVHKIIKQLKKRRSKLERGGIIWHTQGSGKSLTMLFVARKLKKISEFGGHKIIFVTNRLQLETQTDQLFASLGYTVTNPNSIRELKLAIKEDIGNLVLAMVHKFREPEIEQRFPVLNTSSNILLLIDEAHIGYFKILGANLEQAMPNAVKVAFSGTPTERAEMTFGDYIDKYSMEQAVQDEVTVKIIYEGRTHNAEVVKPEELDKKFIDVFADVPESERAMILGRYTRQAYLEAKEVIEGKARDMMEHYLKNVFPNKFKAQVVAVSREAALRYKHALDKVLVEKIKYFENNPNTLVDLGILKEMKIETVFAEAQNDPPEYKPYNQGSFHKNVVTRFKLRFGEEKNGLVGDVGFIVVQNMLLLGFDAPVEQVMYLDRKVVDHSLLQAIARVNRVAKNKTCGYVVDYVGIANHLKEALANYSDRDVVDIERVLIKKEVELQNLRFSQKALVDFFTENQVCELDENIEKAVEILEDEEKRLIFLNLYKRFTKDMDSLLPNPKALDFLSDLKLFTLISHLARTRYRDDKFSAEGLSVWI